jgi:hypothetical protein
MMRSISKIPAHDKRALLKFGVGAPQIAAGKGRVSLHATAEQVRSAPTGERDQEKQGAMMPKSPMASNTLTPSEGATPGQRVIENEHDNRANDCDQKTPGIKAGHPYLACCVENETSNESPDDAKRDVKHDTLARCVDDLARDEACD